MAPVPDAAGGAVQVSVELGALPWAQVLIGSEPLLFAGDPGLPSLQAGRLECSQGAVPDPAGDSLLLILLSLVNALGQGRFGKPEGQDQAAICPVRGPPERKVESRASLV